jgi:hypothetical protein
MRMRAVGVNQVACVVACVVVAGAFAGAGCASAGGGAAALRGVAGGTTRVVPAGTALVARLDRALATDTARAGQAFSATLVDPIVDPDGRQLVPRGARVSGRVDEARRGDEDAPPGLSLRAERLRVGARTLRIDGRVTWAQSPDEPPPPGEPLRNYTASGFVLGAILMGVPGALVGGTTGLAGGTRRRAREMPTDLRLPVGSPIVVELRSPLRL